MELQDNWMQNTNPQENCFRNIYFLLKLLLWKNFIMAKRNRKNIIILFLTPLAICTVLITLQAIADHVVGNNIINPPIQSTNYLKKCENPKEECVTLGYAILGNKTSEWIDYTLNYIANKSQLTLEKDIKMYYHGNNASKYFEYLGRNPNKTLVGIIFCTLDEEIRSNIFSSVTCNNMSINNRPQIGLFTYNIIFNRSFIPSSFFTDQAVSAGKSPEAFQLKLIIDNALASYLNWKKKKSLNLEENNIKNIDLNDFIKVDTQDFPKVPNRSFKGFDIMSTTGSFYFLIPPMFFFIFIQNEIVKEKEKKLRIYLNLVGISHFIYWLSWLITSLIYTFLLSLSMAIFGYIFQFDYFTQTPFMLFLILFFLICLSMQFVTYFISTIVDTLKFSNTITYGFFLFAWVVQVLMSNIVIIYLLYQDKVQTWMLLFRYFLQLYPPFQFAKIWGDISQKSGYHYNFDNNDWETENGYQWNDIYKPRVGRQLGTKYYAPPTSTNLLLLLMDTILFGILAWYFDHILSHNRGKSLTPYFFFTSSYWCPKRKNKIKKTFKKKKGEILIDEDNEIYLQNIEMERKKVEENLENGVKTDGIRIYNLSKIFRNYSSCFKSKYDVDALKDIFLEIDKGEVTCILGHNGAGKTTLINIMTGLLNATSGKVFISNFDISIFGQEIRKSIGICPQFDILWENLTAREHIKLYSMLKNKNQSNVFKKYKLIHIIFLIKFIFEGKKNKKKMFI